MTAPGPATEIALLSEHDLLSAPLPVRLGGIALGSDPATAALLGDVLRIIGRGSLALGRLYEGHVNALGLVARYGSPDHQATLAEEVSAGRISAVWMAGPALRLERQADGTSRLRGTKILCSGAGFVRRPLVAADLPDGTSTMLLPAVTSDRADARSWTPQGMRATATGEVDFSDIVIGATDLVGAPGDYLRSPYFQGGAWRVLAVQLGGLQSIMAHYRDQVSKGPHRDQPLQLARYGRAMIAAETARHWVTEASRVAEGPFEDARAVDAYVNLARNAFEGAALTVMEAAQKAVGLNALLRPNPLERVVRDLATYLRQPALDPSLLSAAAFDLARPGPNADDPNHARR